MHCKAMLERLHQPRRPVQTTTLQTHRLYVKGPASSGAEGRRTSGRQMRQFRGWNRSQAVHLRGMDGMRCPIAAKSSVEQWMWP